MSISHPSQGKNNSTKLLTSVTHVYTELCASSHCDSGMSNSLQPHGL